MSSKILVVDDEAKIVRLVRSYLEQAGFAVVEAADGQTALIQARREKPDLVVLDLGLPGIDGLEVARTLRRERETPIIMLTARIEDTDKIVGLELGADDYVTKPFNPRELVARVRAVIAATTPMAASAIARNARVSFTHSRFTARPLACSRSQTRSGRSGGDAGHRPVWRAGS